MNPRIILWLYVLASVANLIAQIMLSDELNRYTKPVLMPLLLMYIYYRSIGMTTSKTLLLSVAILFSWLGDVVLMYQSNQSYFIGGIGLFLVAQVTYVIVLRKSSYQKPRASLIKTIPFVLYAVFLFSILLPAGAFSIPIIVYGLVILLMMITAYFRKGLTSQKSFLLVFAGSVLFVLSDSILAINAFKSPLPYAGFWIMATYCIAQYLLVEGVLEHKE